MILVPLKRRVSFSDRRVYAVENGLERELYEHEINELDHLRRVILKKRVLQQ